MFNRTKVLASLATAATLALTGCGASNSGGGSDSSEGSGKDAAASKWADCDMHDGVADVSSVSGQDEDKNVTIGAFNGWDESFATAHLLKAVLEQDGYTVDIKAFDAAPGFTAVAQGDVDFLTDGWLPVTHADYLDKYGDQLDSLGCWYDNAKLTIAVNEDSPAKSIADLAEMGDEYNNSIVGIEPGAGLTKQTKEKAIPEYGLDKLSFTTSSTPAMLAAVKKSQADGSNIAVTLWRPHWAYDAYPMRDLEDPKGAMGGKEIIYSFATKGYEKKNPKAAQLVKNLVLDDEKLSSLENMMFGEDNFAGKDNDAAVQKWLSENPDFAGQLKAGKL
ncbi:glycine betaine ABC transporter substrate-binding protein [Cumulibacter manganitolerans]|uniref:glycine betaine ABC transporter substrate-binding protein n=1 Tax=Cumulibacter manganitolerans TaxID=1884992 RepID=UPI001E346ED8|nr:glycine betaine ABC transporter substrate-binding protein [Cumulibacter manganitolerans]